MSSRRLLFAFSVVNAGLWYFFAVGDGAALVTDCVGVSRGHRRRTHCRPSDIRALHWSVSMVSSTEIGSGGAARRRGGVFSVMSLSSKCFEFFRYSFLCALENPCAVNDNVGRNHGATGEGRPSLFAPGKSSSCLAKCGRNSDIQACNVQGGQQFRNTPGWYINSISIVCDTPNVDVLCRDVSVCD